MRFLRWTAMLLRALLALAGLLIGTAAMALFLVDWPLARFLVEARAPFGVFLARLLLAATLLVLVHLLPPDRRGRRVTAITLAIAALFGAFAILGLMRRPAYPTEALQFDNRGVTLSGTLYKPEGAGPWPAMVIVHGSPPFPRGFYNIWSEFLRDRGMAVLSYDKRGTGRSGGTFVQDGNSSPQNLELLAADVVAAVRTLERRRDIDRSRIGLWGISQAGWVIPLAASKLPDLWLAIIVSGPTVTVGEEDAYSELTGDDGGGMRLSPAEAEARIGGKSGFDPLPYLQRMQCPALWIYGAGDRSVPVKKSAAIVQSLAASGKPFSVTLLPDADHFMVTRRGLLPDLDPGVFEAMARWLEAREK